MSEPKHVLITGASSGIGRVCAEHLDRAGFSVLAGVRREADGKAVESGSSNRLRAIIVDVTDQESIAKAYATVEAATGAAGLCGLVNNAGIAVAGPLEAIPLDALRRQIDVNVIGQLAMVQAFLPLLRAARGRIVNMSSVSGRVVFPLIGSYCISKFALEAMSDALRLELRNTGIHVSLIEPGVVDTPIWGKSMPAGRAIVDGMPAEAKARYGPLADAVEAKSRNAQQNATPCERVAEAVLHALSARRPKPRYIVGRDSALAIRLLNRFPTRFRDWVIMRGLRPPRR